MNVATEVNKEVLGQIAAESIAKINPASQNGKRWINAIAKATPDAIIARLKSLLSIPEIV